MRGNSSHTVGIRNSSNGGPKAWTGHSMTFMGLCFPSGLSYHATKADPVRLFIFSFFHSGMAGSPLLPVPMW